MAQQFLDFERPIEALYDQIDNIKHVGHSSDVDVESTIQDIEDKIDATRKKIYNNLDSWQRVQVSRHPNRPYTLAYIERISDEFVELKGDRNSGDDNALIGGLAKIGGHSMMVIGQQKGVNTKMRQKRNFGMPNPEGYRKALRLMKLAEKFDLPIVTFIDTPGAYPGLEAEERGQGEAIARNLFEMVKLTVPVICVIIGEGASGGALGIGIGDKTYMLENAWYSVISPENCSTILWKSWDHKEKAAEQLKLTSGYMKKFGLIDEVIPEPLGGAHVDYDKSAAAVKKQILKGLSKLEKVKPEDRINQRIEKYSNMGFYDDPQKKNA